MSRRNDRMHAFRLVFQSDFNQYRSDSETIDSYFECFGFGDDSKERSESVDRQFVESEFLGTMENLKQIDEIIEKYAVGFLISRLSKMDLAILRLAVYEFFNTDIPIGVTVNEAVELSKTYSTDEAPPFINAILGNIAKEVKK